MTTTADHRTVHQALNARGRRGGEDSLYSSRLGWAVIFAALVTIVCIANGWEWIAVACAAAVVLSAFLVAAQVQDTRQRHHDADWPIA